MLFLFCVYLFLNWQMQQTKGGRIVVGVLGVTCGLWGNGKWFKWFKGQDGGPLPEFFSGPQKGQDRHLSDLTLVNMSFLSFRVYSS